MLKVIYYYELLNVIVVHNGGYSLLLKLITWNRKNIITDNIYQVLSQYSCAKKQTKKLMLSLVLFYTNTNIVKENDLTYKPDGNSNWWDVVPFLERVDYQRLKNWE